MKTELKTSLSSKKTLLIISFLCLISVLACCLFGEITLPVAAAFLAVLYVFDEKKRRIFSRSVSAIVLIINLAAVLLGFSASLFGVEAIVLSVIIYFAFSKQTSKSDASYLMTVILAVLIALGGILLAVMVQGEFSIEAVSSFYMGILSYLKEIFVNSAMLMYGEMLEASGNNFTAEDFGAIFDTVISMTISYVIIASFLLVGLTMKLFTAITARLSEDKREVLSWRFIPTNVFAYFYLILTFASLFVTSSSDLISVSILNLYYVFMVIFAYSGFNFMVVNLAKRFNRFVAFILPVISIVLFSSFAIQLLAVIGVFFTFAKNRENIQHN
nr:DUF2232 domain-containing protein [Oscillospiraceae bacterium]